MKKWLRLFTLGSALCFGQAAEAELISRSALLQYQYAIDVKACNVNLSDGNRVEFTGVFANENGQTAFHELVVFTLKTSQEFSFAALAVVKYYDQTFWAKVVKLEPGYVGLAMDAAFLNLFWGSENAFAVHEFDRAGGRAVEHFSLPGNHAVARAALSRGKSCQQDAQNVD